jgi:hypothetical protein
LQATGQQDISAHLNATITTPKERAIADWMKLIVDKDKPLSDVEDEVMRSFSKHEVKVSAKLMKDVIYKLTEDVQAAISKEMVAAPIGSIMHDGWSRSSTHYFGLFACYNRIIGKRVVPTNSLLAMSPLPKATEEEEEAPVRESSSFDAETHKHFILKVFKKYCPKLNFHTWCVAQVCDNADVNKLLATKLCINQIGCKSHQLALDIKDMMTADRNLTALLDAVHTTMSSIKRRNKNAALLRNITDLGPVLPNKTRWSGKYKMVARYCRSYQDITEAANQDIATIEMDQSNASLPKAKSATSMLEELNAVTKALQERHLTLADGRRYLDELQRTITRKKNVSGHPFYQCKFKLAKAASVSQHTPDAEFEAGVVKIQSGRHEELTAEEEEACKCLLQAVDSEDDDAIEPNDEGSPLKMKDRIKKMKETRHLAIESNPYNDCSFIFASSAEVERLWSLAGNVFTNERRSLTKLLLEAIIFLKVNRRLWSDAAVFKAYNEVKDGKRPPQSVKDDEEEAFLAALADFES